MIHPPFVQAVFHHIFICAIEDISSSISTSDMYSLEFETAGGFSIMSVRFWKGESLVRVQLYRCLISIGIPASYFTGASRLLSVSSSSPKLVSVSGCPASVLQTFDDCELFNYGIQYPFRFDIFSEPALMHQSDSNVFGTTDFHSQLKYLIVNLSGILVRPWIPQATELAKVSIFSLSFLPKVVDLYGISPHVLGN